MSFCNQAMSAVSKALKRLEKLGIPTKRPTDFLAEMAKSDAHMKKVREKLLSKQLIVERSEKVRAIREQKKQGKKVQQKVLQQKREEKKKMLNALKKTKKGKMGADKLLEEKKFQAKPMKNKRNREFRDSKYGYGGKKKGAKWNTADSSAMYPGKQKEGTKNKFSKDKKQKWFKPRAKKHRRR
ncbi:putative rRNA-processing protein EBP2, partial [Stegodyphus mimosarum]